MSFRIEEKLHVDRYKLTTFKDWLYKNGGHSLYDSRTVSSTYFDNRTKDMFHDSEEGCVPRKKIRVRSYSLGEHKIESSTLETKISSIEGRYKIKEKNFNLSKIMKIGVIDSNYGVCKPIVRVTYDREYFMLFGVRITIDRNIRYKALNSTFMEVRDPGVAVEIKANYQTSAEYLIRKFPFIRTRLSKYSNAINILNIH